MATVTPGLEAVAIAEIIETVSGAVIVSTSRGKVYAQVPALDPALTALRTVDNLYLYLGEVEVGVRLPDSQKLVNHSGFWKRMRSRRRRLNWSTGCFFDAYLTIALPTVKYRNSCGWCLAESHRWS